MSYLKYIAAIVGYSVKGIWGAIVCFAIVYLIEKFFFSKPDVVSSPGGDSQSEDDILNRIRQEQAQSKDPRQEFLFALMVLSAHIVQADGKIMHSEMELVRQFLRANFGDAAVEQGNKILLRLFEYRKQHDELSWKQQIAGVSQRIRFAMPEEHRLQLMAFLAEIAKADGNVDYSEVTELRNVAYNLGLNPNVVDQILSLGGDTLDDAYKVLGLTKDATDDEVRKAYRKLALQYHPDRVATLGEDVKEAANKKFQKLNEAKEKIYKARNM